LTVVRVTLSRLLLFLSEHLLRVWREGSVVTFPEGVQAGVVFVLVAVAEPAIQQ